MKKTLLFLLLAIMGNATLYAYDACIDGIYYDFSGDQAMVTYKTTAYNSYSGDIVIPTTVSYNGKTYKVTTIGDYAFSDCVDLTSISIPEGITSIGRRAFYDCHTISSIYIPKSVTKIGYQGFKLCDGLKRVEFESIEALCKISFGSQAANPLCHGHNLYINGEQVTDVVVPESVTIIYNHAFHSCHVNSITLHDGITAIGIHSFACSTISSMIIPDGVSSIGKNDFDGCQNLSSITIGRGVTSIGESAFVNCNSLKDVYCLAEQVPTTNSTAFTNTPIETATLHVPAISVNSYKASLPWKNFGSIQSIKYNLTYIVDGEVYKTYELENGVSIIPEPVPTKEGYTFSGWSYIPPTMPASDVVVMGSFSINSYTLTYKVDGEEYKTSTVVYGTEIVPEEEPSKEGYTFSGWSEIPATMPAHDVEVTGSFSVNSYTLIYLVDGEVYKTASVAYGTELIPEAEPTKEGYTFSGWSEIPETMPASDVVVTGSFTINSYTLTYLVDGEIYKTSDIEYGAPITPEPFPTREGHTFNGWSEIPATMPAHDVVVTGTFSINSYFLFYVLDGSIYKAYNVQYGSEIVPEEEPIKEGYTFSGWEGLPETMPAHDVTVQGSFSINMATGIMLDKEALLFNSFDAQKLNVTLTPDNLFNKTVLWSSSDTDIATVDEDGLVTPINNGEAIITVCTTDGTGLEASCKVTVDFKATALGLDKVNLLITELKSQQLTAYITPAKARFEVAWSSSNESIVTVSETGNITPLRNGEATITVATTDGTDLSSTCLVTVNIPSQFEVVATQTTLAIQSRSGEAEAQNINVTIEGTTYNLSDVEKLTGLAPGTTYHLEVNAVIDGYNWTEEMDVTMAEIAVNFDGKTSPTTLDINASYDAGDATIISAGFEGEEEEVSTLSLNGLDPGQTYDFTYSINTEEGGTYTYKAQFTTEALTLEISRTKVVQVGDVVVVAGSNITEEENVQVGFEWRRYDWPDEIQTKAGAAFIYAGTIEGSIKNLNADKFWKIRPYFLSQAGNRYWGDWVTVDPSDASYFEPSVHTYNSVSIEDNTAEVKGFVMQGSDDVEQQGFMYWTASPQSSSRRNANGVPSDAKVVEANGNMMVASLKDLEYETEYSYVAFVKTSGGETFYGEKQTFTTGEMDPDGIKEIESLTPALSKGEGVWYSLDGKKLSKPQRGINIINGKKIAIK